LGPPRSRAIKLTDRGEVSARAVAADGEPCAVGAERGRVFGDPLGRGVAIVGRRRELVLGGESVIDRHDDGTGLLGEVAADGVVGLERADYPTAAVEEDEERPRCAPVGRVDAERNLAGRPWNASVVDRRERLGRAAEGRDSVEGLARLRDG
jgi:hypothetical protein